MEFWREGVDPWTPLEDYMLNKVSVEKYLENYYIIVIPFLVFFVIGLFIW